MRNLIFLLFTFLISIGGKCQTLQPGTGSFMYSGYGPFKENPIRVFYHIPTGISDSMPILMAFHGEDRNGQSYLNDWISAANQYQFMVFAPEFSEANFPGGDAYNLANIFVDGDNPTPQNLNPDSAWTFSTLDPLFEEIKYRTANISAGYTAFGHSAGSQFLSRFLIFKPGSKMKMAICANAGWYTVPNFNINFPYGLLQSPANEASLKAAFSQKLLILLGKLDNNPNSPGLRHNQQVDAQGLHRLARGRHFFAESQKTAADLNTPFFWKLSEVAAVAHDHTLMAKNALPFVLESFSKPVPPTTTDEPDLTYSSEGIRISELEQNENFAITAFNLSGQPIWSTSGTFQNTQTISWKPVVKGIYLLQIKPEKSPAKTIKILINK